MTGSTTWDHGEVTAKASVEGYGYTVAGSVSMSVAPINPRNHWSIHFKCVDFMACALYIITSLHFYTKLKYTEA